MGGLRRPDHRHGGTFSLQPGELILIIVWAIRLTSCFVYRGVVNIRRERGGDGKVTAEHVSITPSQSREGTVRGGEEAA